MNHPDILNILKLTAGDNFTINDFDGKSVTVVHRRCGHVFNVTISEVATRGFRCSRCDDMRIQKPFTVLKEVASLELYDRCMSKLPKGFSIYGDTSDENNSIQISWSGGNRHTITVADLLNDKNLPDCLVHRNKDLKPSLQLSILDRLVEDYVEILDDFESLDDEVRVKDNKAGTIASRNVQDILQEIEDSLDKNNKQIYSI